MSYGADIGLEAAVRWWWEYPLQVESTNVEQDLVVVVREETVASN